MIISTKVRDQMFRQARRKLPAYATQHRRLEKRFYDVIFYSMKHKTYFGAEEVDLIFAHSC